MGKDLLADLVDKPQRETAGPDVNLRFDYQKNWAFCQMLRRHMDNADYLVAFEFHDDVLFLSPYTNPKTAEFFQVKTSKSAKPRKLTDLINPPHKKPNSIIGKMFLNFSGVCGDHELRVILVSNAAFEFTDKDISAKDLDPKYRDKIVAKLKAEIPTFTEAQIDRLHFMVTGVSIEAMQSYMQGEAMELFRSEFGEDHGFNVHSWIRLVQGEIFRRSSYPSDKITSSAELISKKCIGRKAIDASLKLVAAQRRPAPDMMLVAQDLKAAGWKSQDIMRLGKAMPEATYDYNDTTNSEVVEIVKALSALLSKLDGGDPALSVYLAECEKQIRPSIPQPYNKIDYFAALALVVFHEKL